MNNVKRQLVLTYPNQHQFKVEETTDTYKVLLKIELMPVMAMS